MKRPRRPLNQCDADQHYPISEACQFFPSRQGRHITKETLRGWVKRGLVPAIQIAMHPDPITVIRGDVIIRMVTGTPTPSVHMADPDVEELLRSLRRN